MRPTRLWLPVVAGILGIAAGVATSLVVTGDPEPGASTTEDPLHLGIPLVDLDCTGETVLVVGRGDSTAPLAVAVANNPDLPLRYLRTDDSCETLWAHQSQERPEYAVYAGPYDGMTEPCELRMQVDHKGDAVTNLTRGNDRFVRCLCALPAADFPDLSVDVAVSPASSMWVRSLQSMLVDLDRERQAEGEPPPYFRPADVSGVYDETTRDRIEAYQAESDIAVSEYGEVRLPTWRSFTDEVCKLYSF